MRALVPSFCLLVLAAPALGQERSAAQKETLTALARVLGEAQALRQVCSAADPAWRSFYEQMLDVEAPDEDFGQALDRAFNAGFTDRRGEFQCGPASRMEEAKAALRGRELASGLSRATVRIHPEDVLALPEESLAVEEEAR